MVYIAGALNGSLSDWRKLISAIGLKDSDMVFVTGNVIGGSEDIPLLLDLMDRTNVFPLMGSREFAFMDCVTKLDPDATMADFMKNMPEDMIQSFTAFIEDGGRETFTQYMALSAEERESILEYLEEFSLHEELRVDGQDFIVTHSGLAGFDPEKSLDDYALFDFLTARPEPGEKFFEEKRLIFGHTPTYEYGNKYRGQIVKTESFINVNCGCGDVKSGGRLACLRLNDMKEFYV